MILTAFLLNKEEKNIPEGIEKIVWNEETRKEDIEKASGKYLMFVKNLENIEEDFWDQILEKVQTEFDVCTINYTIEVDKKTLATEKLEPPEIQRKPYKGSYIWSFIFKKEKLLEILEKEEVTDEIVDSTFTYVNYIEKPIYHHIPTERVIHNFLYTDEKEEVRRKNIIYMGTYCNGQFNGYITWLNNIGRCFGEEFPITILYDKIYPPTKKAFERYFEVLERKEDTLYITNRLITTYSTYYYPKNILTKEDSYLFIHGNMCDYPSSRKYKYDNYTKYIGVSKISAEKAKDYFPTEEYDYIINPIQIDESEVKPHLKLVSALRNDPIKKIERIHQIATILDEEEIPYTWNVFIDSCPYDSNVYGGLIYRRSVQNPLPYIKDADYFVQLSNSEACSYSVMEALSLNTKVILTPLECYEEMKVDSSQGFLLPFEIFEKDKKEELREVVKRIYKEKERPMTSHLNPSMWEKYKELFEK